MCYTYTHCKVCWKTEHHECWRYHIATADTDEITNNANSETDKDELK